MPEQVDEPLTLEDAGQMDLEDAEGTTFGQLRGEAYVDKNGFTNKRAVKIDRSTFDATVSAVDRT